MKRIIGAALIAQSALVSVAFAAETTTVTPTEITSATNAVGQARPNDLQVGQDIKDIEMRIKALNQELEARIKALREEYRKKVEALRNEARTKVGKARQTEQTRREAQKSVIQTERAELQQKAKQERQEVRENIKVERQSLKERFLNLFRRAPTPTTAQ